MSLPIAARLRHVRLLWQFPCAFSGDLLLFGLARRPLSLHRSYFTACHTPSPALPLVASTSTTLTVQMSIFASSMRLALLRRTFCSTPVQLSGHNKWSKIEKKKGIMDRKKSAIYNQTNRDITVAIKTGGSPDPEKNSALAAVLKAAKANGVPKENIQKALDRASGEKGKGSQDLMYEAMAHGTVGVIIESLTDNRDRTHHALRDILKGHNARFAPVAFMFQRKGRVRVALEHGTDPEPLIETALEAGAEDFETLDEPEEDSAEVTFICPPSELSNVAAAVTAPGKCKELLERELIYVPSEPSEEPDESLRESIANLVEDLEDNESTMRVWTSLD
ncbi:DUF28-domain-containing protein [Heliocybe sulcata]|uniref:DUF28-domain-containing protein n=1 Tax=Heliocybe sulcata TaxID=5364 RepID=A0A5C3NC60_9AGAM|nr:DUF28-domain-containing protein [Heliocybe sulcata]